MGKRIKIIPFWEKSRTKSKQCYHNDICECKRDSFSSEVEIASGIVRIKMLKREF